MQDEGEQRTKEKKGKERKKTPEVLLPPAAEEEGDMERERRWARDEGDVEEGTAKEPPEVRREEEAELTP